MKSVRVCFLIFLLFKTMCCEGCWKEEKKALLGINSRFDDPSSWKVHTDCCEWEGVHCNPSTGRVAELYLDGPWKSTEQYINYTDFTVFKDLKNLSLTLTYKNIVGCVGELPNLQLLSFSYSKLDTAGSIISCLDGLPSLNVSQKLRSNLEVLDISWNHLTNEIVHSVEGFTSLKELYLADNELDSDLDFQGLCSKLRNLEVLDLSYNNCGQTDIGSVLSGLSFLKYLYLEKNELSWRSIYNISKLSSLEVLDLDFNDLNESESILRRLKENETFKWPTNLQHLDLSSTRLSNKSLSSSISGLSHLKYLDLSYNQLQKTLDISGHYMGRHCIDVVASGTTRTTTTPLFTVLPVLVPKKPPPFTADHHHFAPSPSRERKTHSPYAAHPSHRTTPSYRLSDHESRSHR
ncbi:hypothetical protein V8G54_011035 [Vigna mungo]|uniref:Leucine-rich repeat-containing N-terminal plant-type domain-containing protein n=1 Tax=Vigna mungo TaxID=3915 RepID=A0AAQ3NN90_VIGMU